MPMDRTKYPTAWDAIALDVKTESDWQCEKCGKQCRRPGEPFDTHRRTLTTAHCNHRPMDCRPENLAALCAPCHLKYDAKYHAKNRKGGQMDLDFNIKRNAAVTVKDVENINIGIQPGEIAVLPDTPLIVDPDSYDLEIVKKIVQSYDDEFKKLRDQVDALQVTDEKTAETATEMYAQLKGLHTDIEEKRKADTKKRRSWVRSYDSIVKPVRDKIEFLQHTIKQDKLNPYHYQVEQKRRAEEKRQKDAQAAIQKKMDDEAKKHKVEPVVMPKMTVPKKTAPIRTAVGTASTRMVWKFEIDDAGLLERKYLMPDHKAIKQAIDGGIRKIKGVRIYEEATTQIRKN